jgi:hypothetical protein
MPQRVERVANPAAGHSDNPIINLAPELGR